MIFIKIQGNLIGPVLFTSFENIVNAPLDAFKDIDILVIENCYLKKLIRKNLIKKYHDGCGI